MRCSMRESHMLQPAFFTSTPISKRRRISVFNYFENSPINRSNFDLMPVPKQLLKYQNQKKEQITVFKVLENEKIPLIKEKRGACSKKSTLSHPPMIVISDSEEDKSDIYSEVTLAPNSNSSSRNMNQQKENAKRVKRRSRVKSLKENLLKTESKKSQKRISRVDTIIDEIMKEQKSTVLSPSPLAKLKSEYSVDAVVDKQGKNDLEIRRVTRSSVLFSQDFRGLKENKQRHAFVPNILGAEGVTQTKSVEITGKLQDIENFGDINNIGRTRKRAQSVIKKEKDIQYQEEKKSNCEDLISNNPNNKPNLTFKMSKVEPFNENLPVFYNQEEVNANEWIQVNGQNGVFVKKNFRVHGVSNGFVKIEAKCSLLLNSVRSQIFSVAEGRGIFVYDNDNIKVKLGPGQTVVIPAGFPCKIINTGLKKNFVFTFVKVYEAGTKL